MGCCNFYKLTLNRLRTETFFRTLSLTLLGSAAGAANWRHELVLERESKEFTDAIVAALGPQQRETARFFHIPEFAIAIAKKLAASTVLCIWKKVTPASKYQYSTQGTVEFKWAGVMLPSVGIAPGGVREFDAFCVLHPDPTQVLFNAFSDSKDYYPALAKGPADYEFSHVVRSENFSPARGTLQALLGEIS